MYVIVSTLQDHKSVIRFYFRFLLAPQGDSGGPLVCPETGSDGVARYTMYGVVSAGIDGQCGSLYGLYTQVSSYLTWIQANRN